MGSTKHPILILILETFAHNLAKGVRNLNFLGKVEDVEFFYPMCNYVYLFFLCLLP